MYERIKEDGGRSLSEFTDADQSRRTYYLVIVIGCVANLLSWTVALLTPEAVAEWVGVVTELSGKANAILLAFPFWSTFFAAYAALRLPAYKNETASLADDDVMASYRDAERSNYIRNRILLALSAAAVNTIFLVAVART